MEDGANSVAVCPNSRGGGSRCSGSSRGSAVGRLGLAFIPLFITLAVIAKKVAKPLGGIDVSIVVVAERDDGRVFIQHANDLISHILCFSKILI